MSIRTLVARSYGHTALLGFPCAVALVLLGASPASSDVQEPQELTVQRINIVEPDGALRMVISNSARMHPGQIGGVELPPRPRPAGILYFDDLGDEAGGMGIVGDQQGRYGGIVVDQIGNDESMRLVSHQVMTDEGLKHRAGLSVTDRNPDVTLPMLMQLMEEVQQIEDPSARQTRFDELTEQYGTIQADRLFVGRSAAGGVIVDMRDATGVPRLRMAVSETGEASIEFLDAEGKVTRTLTGGD